MKNSKLMYLCLALVTPLSLTSCINDPSSVTFKLADLGTNVEIHQEHQALYLQDNDYEDVGTYSAYAPAEDYTNPISVHFSWKVTSAKKYIVSIYEDGETTPITYETSKQYLDIYNLKVNTSYNWTVSAVYPSNTFTSEPSSFKTTTYTPRNIYLEGVDNVRDIGGNVGLNNKIVKQGLLYRSAELNESKKTSNIPLISEAGIQEAKNILKIKTDIDLRKNVESNGVIENSGLNFSPLGEDVNYINLPMYYDGQNMLKHSDSTKLQYNVQAIKTFFETLAVETNYPMIFHCVQGKDRTGMLAYLLNALLGVNEEQLYRDYLFTNFSKAVGSPCKLDDIDKRYGRTIKEFGEGTLQERTYQYLDDMIGIDNFVLDKVIDIFLD